MGCSNDYSIEVEKERSDKRHHNEDSSSEDEEIQDFEECESK